MANHQQRNRGDASFLQTKALPAADGSVYTTAFDLVSTENQPEGCEMQIVAPALTTTELPDADTATYKVQQSTDNSTFTTLADAVILQTGAGSAGAATATVRFRIPSDCDRYVRVAVTTAGTSGDCSGKSVSAQLLF